MEVAPVAPRAKTSPRLRPLAFSAASPRGSGATGTGSTQLCNRGKRLFLAVACWLFRPFRQRCLGRTTRAGGGHRRPPPVAIFGVAHRVNGRDLSGEGCFGRCNYRHQAEACAARQRARASLAWSWNKEERGGRHSLQSTAHRKSGRRRHARANSSGPMSRLMPLFSTPTGVPSGCRSLPRTLYTSRRISLFRFQSRIPHQSLRFPRFDSSLVKSC